MVAPPRRTVELRRCQAGDTGDVCAWVRGCVAVGMPQEVVDPNGTTWHEPHGCTVEAFY